MDKQIFQLPGVIVSDKSMANGARRFVIETQENMTAAGIQRLISLENKLGWFTFNVKEIEAVDIINLPNIDTTAYVKGKTPSARLRSIIFLIWQQKGKKGNFDAYYANSMENIIEHMKEKLE